MTATMHIIWTIGSFILFISSGASSATGKTGNKHDKLVVCYGSYPFRLIDAKALEAALPYCTHIVYVGLLKLGLDDDTNKFRIPEPFIPDVGGHLIQLANLKKINPEIKILISIGGWEGVKFTKLVYYSQMIKNYDSRRIFIESGITFLNKYNVDGIEIYMNNIEEDQREESDNLVLLVKEMSEAFTPVNKTISIAVNASEEKYGMNLAGLSKYVHHISVRSYHYHGYRDKQVGVSSSFIDVLRTLDMLDFEEASFGKLLLGINSDAGTNILSESPSHLDQVIGQPAWGQGFTTTGYMPYNELCKFEAHSYWKKKWHEMSRTPYLINLDDKPMFISYDDTRSICEKVNLILERQLGGVAYYTLAKDDHSGVCWKNAYPLLRTIVKVLQGEGQSECECPHGFYGGNCSTPCSGCKNCDAVIGDCVETTTNNAGKFMNFNLTGSANLSSNKEIEQGLSQTMIIVITVISTAIFIILLLSFIFFKKIRMIFEKPHGEKRIGPISNEAYDYHNHEWMLRSSDEFKGDDPFYEEIGYDTLPGEKFYENLNRTAGEKFYENLNRTPTPERPEPVHASNVYTYT